MGTITTTTERRNQPVLAKIRGAGLILESAAANHLPMPWSVDTATFLPVTLIFQSPGDIAVWAAWCKTEIQTRPALVSGGSVVDQFDAALFGVEFSCRCTHAQAVGSAVA